jgi:hypothetical protein
MDGHDGLVTSWQDGIRDGARVKIGEERKREKRATHNKYKEAKKKSFLDVLGTNTGCVWQVVVYLCVSG